MSTLFNSQEQHTDPRGHLRRARRTALPVPRLYRYTTRASAPGCFDHGGHPRRGSPDRHSTRCRTHAIGRIRGYMVRLHPHHPPGPRTRPMAKRLRRLVLGIKGALEQHRAPSTLSGLAHA